jgi:hypothetical protein
MEEKNSGAQGCEETKKNEARHRLTRSLSFVSPARGSRKPRVGPQHLRSIPRRRCFAIHVGGGSSRGGSVRYGHGGRRRWCRRTCCRTSSASPCDRRGGCGRVRGRGSWTGRLATISRRCVARGEHGLAWRATVRALQTRCHTRWYSFPFWCVCLTSLADLGAPPSTRRGLTATRKPLARQIPQCASRLGWRLGHRTQKVITGVFFALAVRVFHVVRVFSCGTCVLNLLTRSFGLRGQAGYGRRRPDSSSGNRRTDGSRGSAGCRALWHWRRF